MTIPRVSASSNTEVQDGYSTIIRLTDEDPLELVSQQIFFSEPHAAHLTAPQNEDPMMIG